MRFQKSLSIILAVIVIVNFLGLIFKVIKPAMFWLVTIAAAVIAYHILPKLRN